MRTGKNINIICSYKTIEFSFVTEVFIYKQHMAMSFEQFDVRIN